MSAIPPHDLAAEAAVLSAILVEGSGAAFDEVAGILSVDSFYADAHRRIFEAAAELHRSGQPTDLVTVQSYLRDHNRLVQVGGSSYLVEVANAAPSLVNTAHYADIVLRKSQRRALIAQCQQIAAQGYLEPTTQEEDEAFRDRAAQSIYDLTHHRSHDHAAEGIGPAAHRTLTAIAQRASRGFDETVEPTEWDELNELIVGLRKKRLYLLAARPGVGKSAFATNLALHVARERQGKQKHVLFFSLEMTTDEIATRALSCIARVDHMRLEKGRLEGGDVGRFSDALRALKRTNLHIVDDVGISLFSLRAMARRLKAAVEKRGDELGLIVVDYLQLLDGKANKRGESREQEVARISRGLKNISKELDCAVLALAQLNRSVEQRSGKDAYPRKSDLRESGALEQDANVILFLHPTTKEPNARGPKEHALIVAKNRGGPEGMRKLMFEGRHMLWRNLEASERMHEAVTTPPFGSAQGEDDSPSHWTEL